MPPETARSDGELQQAADPAAGPACRSFFPPGSYSTSKLELKSGTQIQGVPGRSVLRYSDGGRLISLDGAAECA